MAYLFGDNGPVGVTKYWSLRFSLLYVFLARATLAEGDDIRKHLLFSIGRRTRQQKYALFLGPRQLVFYGEEIEIFWNISCRTRNRIRTEFLFN